VIPEAAGVASRWVMAFSRVRRLAMQFEVEKKFWLHNIDQAMEKLREIDVYPQPPMNQIDKYFAHPARDFMQTDEALRLRSVGEKNFITYKGARIDSTTKTRRELELPLLDGSYAQEFEQLLGVLGFQLVMTIHKLRHKAELIWQDYHVEISLDEIDPLGSFIELETTSDLEHLERAKQALESLAQRLSLDRTERRSYLELMMNHLGPGRIGG
jgi:adenylate cyclase class 2